jgi:TonB-dependent receptor
MMSIIRKFTSVASLLLLAALILSLPALAQSGKGTVSGSITDSSGLVLKGAGVTLLPAGIETATNSQGQFVIRDVAPGEYTLVASYVGFKTYNKQVEVAAGKALNLNFKLEIASHGEEILVTAERVHGEAEAINQIRTADNLIDLLPAEVITSLPNANVADALGRMASITLLRTEGEGQYISVRGTEPRLTNITVDGITIPSPEPTVRQLRLDVIPSDLVEAVEIDKTLSASQDGDGIGGSVNLRMKTASEQPLLTVYGNGGYTPILDGRGVAQTGGTYGQRFGKAKKFGLLFGGTWDYNGRGIDNIQPALDPNSTFAEPIYDNITIREYRYYRDRYGFAGSADYKLGDMASIYAHGMYSDLKDWGDKWYYEPVSGGSPKFYTSSKRPNASVGNLTAGGRHVFKSSWLNWELSASRSYEIDSAGNPKADFSWIGPSSGKCTYAAQGVTNTPDFGTCSQAGSPLLTAANWVLKDLTTSKGLTAQLNLSLAASYAHNYQVGSHFGVIEGGFKVRNGHKYQDATETVYDGWSTKAATGIPMTSLQSDFSNDDYFKGKYFGGHFGPVSDFNKVVSYVNQNLSGDVDGYKTAGAQYPNLFNIIERITAGYVMNTIDFGKLHVQTGLRFEGTQMDTLGYNVTLYAAGSANCPGGKSNTGCGVPTAITNNPSYIDVLPSVQMRYGLTKDSSLRAVYSRGVARPDAYQLVPYVTFDDSSNPGSINIGNPSLKPEHANNYDLLFEKFLNPVGRLEAGMFFKQLTAPQVGISIPSYVNPSTLSAGVIPASLLPSIMANWNTTPSSVSLSANGQNAYVYGFEASYQQHMTFLPGKLRGLGLSANYTYTASQEKGLPLRTDQPALLQQTPNAWNVSPTFDNKHLSVRVGMSYNGYCIYQYSWLSKTLASGADPSGLGPKGPSGDIYTLPHYQLDAQIEGRIGHHLTAMVYGLNLNNEVFGYYQGSTNFVNQREYYKPTYAGGLKYTFGQHEK